MSLIQLLVIIIVAGLIYWLVMQFPLPAPFRKIAQIIMIVIAILWLLGTVGMLPRGLHVSALQTHDVLEARVGIEPTMPGLQPGALPLDYRAMGRS